MIALSMNLFDDFDAPTKNVINKYLAALGKFLNALLFVWIAVLVLRRTQKHLGSPKSESVDPVCSGSGGHWTSHGS